MAKTTISLIKADIGSYPGHSRIHPELLEKAAKMLKAAEGKTIDLDINDWSSVVLALCGAKGDKQWGHKQLLRLATRIANQLAEALGIDPPSFSVK